MMLPYRAWKMMEAEEQNAVRDTAKHYLGSLDTL
jgi:deoxyribodipyrimidine photolyase-like uncharacterized protein